MKSKAEVVERMARKAYSNYMSGGSMMRDIDTDMLSWIYGEDLYEQIKAAAIEIINSKARSK